MREDQKTRLQELSEMLVDALIEEADPRLWPGAGLPLADMSKEQRGDRYWCKKNAASTMVVIQGVDKLSANTKESLGREPFSDDDMDRQISQAEAKASAMLEKVMTGNKYKPYSHNPYGTA